jgi:hypothetical protein
MLVKRVHLGFESVHWQKLLFRPYRCTATSTNCNECNDSQRWQTLSHFYSGFGFSFLNTATCSSSQNEYNTLQSECKMDEWLQIPASKNGLTS